MYVRMYGMYEQYVHVCMYVVYTNEWYTVTTYGVVGFSQFRMDMCSVWVQ